MFGPGLLSALALCSLAFASWAAPAHGSAVLFFPGPEADSSQAETVAAPAGEMLDPGITPGQSGDLVDFDSGQSGAAEISIPASQPSEPAIAQRGGINSRPHGKVYAVWRGIGVGECSGVLVTGRSRPVVLTAAHCVFLIRRGQPARKVDYLRFIPALKPGKAPFGKYRISGKDVYVKPGVAREIKASRTSNDWAFLRFREAKKAQRYVGADGLVFNARKPRDRSVSLIGYPGKSSGGDGQRKIACGSELLGFDRSQRRPRPYVSGCRGAEMPKGTSGGGWRWPSYRADRVLSLTSYKSFYFINDQPRELTAGVQLTTNAYRAYRRASG